ncbi:leucine-rich repeat-domain-containing protein [Phlyctochytrium arcticum]|nr:leucine-rich repeat-domain-containing protein [Phlyctochytrium arcticum]
MVKLNYDVLLLAESRLNAIGDRELDLRGLKIPQIENLAITKDGHDVLDFTDNDLRRLDGFPPMRRLTTLLLSNNRISRIDPSLASQLPNLRVLILNNNSIEELGDLDPLANCERLTTLSLMDNSVATKKYYRLYIIHRCPSVRILDFRKVKEKERMEAAKLFSGEEGLKLAASISAKAAAAQSQQRTFEPGELGAKKTARPYQGPSPEEAARIREAIKNAKTLDEVTRLEKLLTSGQVPQAPAASSASRGADAMEEEEEED